LTLAQANEPVVVITETGRKYTCLRCSPLLRQGKLSEQLELFEDE
jgi:hypothetical protein